MSEQVSAKMDEKDLWKEDVFTDRKVGTIRRLVPVKADGTADASRKAVYVGEAQLMTPAGALPLTFEIPGDTLEAAVAGYADAVQLAFTETMEELKEMRRKASSSIVTPQSAGALGGAGLFGPGAGMPAPGKLKL
jgi:hypothetical protein